MSSVFEKPWFKWVVIGSSSTLLLSVSGGFVLKRYLENRAIEERIEARKRAQEEYEDRFRTVMTRVYENKKLGHYLAAYKNLESIQPPDRSDPLMFQEYLDVLNSVGRGLLENSMLEESENLFRTLKELEGQVSSANEALGQIESKKRLDSSRLHFALGQGLLEEKRYRDAFSEFTKAKLELDSVDLLHFDQTKDDRTKLMPLLSTAKFYTYIEDATNYVSDAERQLRNDLFKEVTTSMSRAANLVGRAAFLKPDAQEVADLRQKLFDLDADLAYRLPNAHSIWNSFAKERASELPHFFYIEDYNFETKLNPDGTLDLRVDYMMNPKDQFYAVRYRIFFYNGRDIFNGQFLTADPKSTSIEEDSVVFKQEVPPEYRNSAVKRVELNIYNSSNVIVSSITRAFRKPGSS